MSLPVTRQKRPSLGGLVGDQIRYAVTEYWRARLVLIFSLFIPLIWLVVIGALAGNEVLEGTGGLRVMQFATPVAVSMGALYAALPTTATSLAHARETRVLQRLRGTPTPPLAYVAGRAIGASAFAMLSVGVMVVVGVTAYDIQVIGSTVVASAVTLAAALLCYVTIGLAIAAVAPSAGTAQAVSIGTVVVLSFISGLFTGFDALPETLSRVAGWFPVKPVTDTLQDQFNPFFSGSAWDLRTFAVLATWSTIAAAVAVRGLSGERRHFSVLHRHPHPAQPGGSTSPRAHSPTVASAPTVGHPTDVAMIGHQAIAGLRLTWRDPGAVFFAILMPAGLYVFLSAVVGTSGVGGAVPVSTRNAASMIAWGLGVTAFMNLPDAVAQARDRGVLKRLHGTPLTPTQFLAGRMVTAVLVNAALAAVIVAIGVVVLGLRLTPFGVLLGLAVAIVGTVSLAALGFLLAAAVPSSRSFGAVAIVVLLTLAFVSDVFLTDAPAWMGTLGSIFPLRHVQQALVAALDPSGASLSWTDAAVTIAWMIVAGVLASRWFRWQSSPR